MRPPVRPPALPPARPPSRPEYKYALGGLALDKTARMIAVFVGVVVDGLWQPLLLLLLLPLMLMLLLRLSVCHPSRRWCVQERQPFGDCPEPRAGLVDCRRSILRQYCTIARFQNESTSFFLQPNEKTDAIESRKGAFHLSTGIFERCTINRRRLLICMRSHLCFSSKFDLASILWIPFFDGVLAICHFFAPL